LLPTKHPKISAALATNKATKALVGYKKLNPVVYSGFYPVDSKDYPILKDALLKISLSDSSIKYTLETSKALGFGFRVGFLGMLHMEVLQERLEREFGVSLIATAPSVEFKVTLTDSKIVYISNPSDLPDPSTIKQIEEPMIKASIVIPEEFIGKVMELCQNKRDRHKERGMQCLWRDKRGLYHICDLQILHSR